jgi:hypothetical protein
MLIFNYFSFYFIWLFLLIPYFKKSKLDFFVYIFIFFGLVWQTVSFFYLSNGGYSSELDFYGSYSLIASISLLVFIIMSLFILKTSKNIFKFINRRKNYSGSSFYQSLVVIFLFSLALGVLTINGFLYGFPLFELMNRFTYWSQASFDFRNIFGYMYILSFFAGYFYRKNRIFVFFIIASIVLSILYSNKFTVLFYLMAYFFIGKYLALDSGFSRKQILYVSLALCFLILSVFYIIFQNNSFVNSFLLERAFGNQGHFLYLSLTSEFMKFEFFKVISNNVSEFFMYHYGDSQFITGILEKGFRFSGLYPALIFFTFSFLPLLLLVLSLFSFYFVLFVLKKSLDMSMIFTPILIVKLLAYFQIFNSGNWQDVLMNGMFFISLFLLFFFYFLEYFLLKTYRKKGCA